jgi:hypothetical protein
MKVHGIEIAPEQINAAKERMKVGPFRASTIAAALEGLGLPADTSYRAADRLIQEQRHAKTIKIVRPWPTWQWVKQ